MHTACIRAETMEGGGYMALFKDNTCSSPSGGGLLSSLGSRPSGLSKKIAISDGEFQLLQEFIYQKCGIHLKLERKYLLENRLADRLSTLGLKSFGEYHKYLKFDSKRERELVELYDRMTTNETSFFRDMPQLKVFEELALKPLIAAQRKKGTKALSLWSAGCSSGEEPYTLAMMVCENLGREVSAWRIRISGHDLSEAVLAKAKLGEYSSYSFKTTPPEMQKKYFDDLGGGNFVVKPEIKRMVTVGEINLTDRVAIKRLPKSHIIFCRNVTIYFDDEVKKQIMQSFYDNLLPEHFIVIGHSESMHHISRSFKPIHGKGGLIYQKM